jgi:hypothetical protein
VSWASRVPKALERSFHSASFSMNLLIKKICRKAPQVWMRAYLAVFLRKPRKEKSLWLMMSSIIWISLKLSLRSWGWKTLSQEWLSAMMERLPSKQLRPQQPLVILKSIVLSWPTAACHSWTGMKPPSRCASSGRSSAYHESLSQKSTLSLGTSKRDTFRRP